MAYEGSCLCGKVKISASVTVESISACHCTTCTRWSSGPYFGLYGEAVEISGEEFIKEFPSSEFAVRGFCQDCGTHLYMKDLSSGSYGLSAGIFNTEKLPLIPNEYYLKSKPSYYKLADVTNSFDTY